MDIPDHLYESEWANQSGSMIEQAGWTGDDYADPDTEPIPSLDEAIEHMRALVGHMYQYVYSVHGVASKVCCDCDAAPAHNQEHLTQCKVGKAEQWLAAKTNDESSDLPW